MIQAIGLTSVSRRDRPPAVDDLTFEAGAGSVTVLLGPAGAGKTTALLLLLQLLPGRGVALFRGRPLRRVPHPSREVGTLLGEVPGHPGRTARGHLRMLAAVSGVPAGRADEVLDVVGLSGLADQRLAAFSRGMDRRLGLAAALLGDPHTLVLDEPARGLSPRETAWLRGLLRGYAAQGGAVLLTARDPKEASRVADRIVTVEAGRLVADQDAGDFSRTRLRPRVTVRTPHAGRLAAALTEEFRAAPRQAGRAGAQPEVVLETGRRLLVYGSDCATVGEVAYRNRVLVHQLAEEEGTSGDRAPALPLARADGRDAPEPPQTPPPVPRRAAGPPPPRLPGAAPPGPSRPLRYELRRLTGLRSSWWIMGAALFAGLVTAAVLGLTGETRPVRVLNGWAEPFPLPPAALAGGLLGALSFGQEFRYPALAPGLVPVPRLLRLLVAKLAVTGGVALLLCCAISTAGALLLPVLFGSGVLPAETSGGLLAAVATGAAAAADTALLAIGCAWAGLLAAGVFRSAPAGLAAVAAVPYLIAPGLRALFAGPAGQALEGLPGRLPVFGTLPQPSGTQVWFSAPVRLASEPVGWALALSLTALLGGYVLLSLRTGAGRPRA
ncbi:ATP-binding cassette domain-containing protein [Streptomyces sp. ACA25]|uniref:ATP-binding cassette domain-containing protein n=1 Tax=Streptomyces sp. ACA25 TaxID=3022596 RepID=UPI002307A15C|nr:ATP-binding cassette domain-containing protein [Streptomyces sp. ACA25]MDB1088822.1 ATP-binding cassette domain-containing protein [Streptomyces sp. ACA25]